MIQIYTIQQKVSDKCDLKGGVHNGYIFELVTKDMYGLPQAWRIAHDDLVKHTEPYEYWPLSKTPGLWIHENCPINFNLVVDDFGVKYLAKEHALNLKAALEDKYKVTTYQEGKLYIDISLKWDYEKGTVQLAMSGYVRAALHSFQQ